MNEVVRDELISFFKLVVDNQLAPPMSNVNVGRDEVSVLDTQPLHDLPWH